MLAETGGAPNSMLLVDAGGRVRMIDCGKGSGPTNLCLRDERLIVPFGNGVNLVAIPRE